MKTTHSKLITLIVLTLALGMAVAADEADHHVEDLLRSRDPDYRMKVTHIHGAGFDGQDLVIATHLGLLRYQGGKWIEEKTPPHDYMGFAVVKDGAYVSGHPSILYADEVRNPLGVMFTDDWGAHLSPLSYYGEIDFHWLSAGYSTDSIYALTSHNPRTGGPLFTVSRDAGTTWDSMDIIGTRGTLQDMAAHPTESAVVYLLTDHGLYVSGESDGIFGEVARFNSMKSLAVDRDGASLYLGGRNLSRLSVPEGRLTSLEIPELNGEEEISEIATGPPGSGLIAFSTNQNNVHISRNDGRTWEQVLLRGNARE